MSPSLKESSILNIFFNISEGKSVKTIFDFFWTTEIFFLAGLSGFFGTDFFPVELSDFFGVDFLGLAEYSRDVTP